MSFVAKVKNVLSGDTLVLVPVKSTQVPVPERILTLLYVRAPENGWPSREYLRQLLIGRDIKVSVFFKNPTTGREFGDVKTPIFNSLIVHLLEKGYVRLKDNAQDDGSDLYEDVIAASQKGSSQTPESETGRIELVQLTEQIQARSQKYPLKCVVERVISGDRVVGRIYVRDNQHIESPILLAGIKSPRTDDETAKLAKVGEQAKQFVEEKLLTTKAEIKVSIVGENSAGLPIGIFIHPSGNSIHEKLLELGLAEIVDWQSQFVGSKLMVEWRKAEQTAKALGKGIFATSTAAKPASLSTGVKSKLLKPGSTLDSIQIARVLHADTLLIRLPQSDEEITVQLASVRAPKPNDSTVTTNSQVQQALVNTAREYVRNVVMGKNVSVYFDGYRQEDKERGFDARFTVSVKLPNGADLSEQIISNGWGTVIRHNKATSGERSLNWDKLVELEEAAKKAGKKGLFTTGDISKVLTVGTRIVDASENFAKAKTFLNGFKQKGRIGGYHVEYVNSVNRVKLYNPKEGLKLTLILGGLSNEHNKSDEGLKFVNKKYLQKNVEFDIYDTDKIGGFIGNLYASPSALSPVQVQLLNQGYVKLHDIAVNSNKFAKEFYEAEDEAKGGKKGLWSNYDAAQEKAEEEEQLAKTLEKVAIESKPKFFDIEVTDVDPTSGVISFQNTSAATVAKFTQFKTDFNDFHAKAPSATSASVDLPFNLNKAPKKGELVSAKFSENGKFYRARVVNFDKASGKYEVKHLDFGNVDKVALSGLRALPIKFSLATYPAFASTTTLQNLRLPPSKPTDYFTDAIYALEDLTYDKKLVLSALPGTKADYTGVLYDSEQLLKDASYTINKQLVKEGWAVVDDTTLTAATKASEYVSGLLKVQAGARADHAGCWEFGDITFDDETF